MSAIDYESEYNNRARVPGHPAIIAGWARDAAAFREVAVMETDIVYGPRPRNRLDMFFPSADRRIDRLAVFIHGGYWQALDKGSFSHLARGPLAHGVAVAIPGYTLCPEVGIGDIVEEMRTACRFLGRRYGIAMTVSGHSAGGHLAAALLATDWGADGAPVTAAQPISGLFDLEPLIATTINGALRLDAEEARRLSPIRWQAPAGLSMHAWVGGAESGEFRRQSRQIAESWGDAGVETRCEEVAGADHFTVVAPLADPGSPMTRDLVALAAAREPPRHA